jgi:hypothetical protein
MASVSIHPRVTMFPHLGNWILENEQQAPHFNPLRAVALQVLVFVLGIQMEVT